MQTTRLKETDMYSPLQALLAFFNVDANLGDHCDQAVKVQQFLREAGYGEWLDNQIFQNKKDTE